MHDGSVVDRRKQRLDGLLLLTAITIIIISIKLGLDAQETDGSESSTNPGDYPCPQCASVFTSEFDRAFHLKWVHGFWA